MCICAFLTACVCVCECVCVCVWLLVSAVCVCYQCVRVYLFLCGSPYIKIVLLSVCPLGSPKRLYRCNTVLCIINLGVGAFRKKKNNFKNMFTNLG